MHYVFHLLKLVPVPAGIGWQMSDRLKKMGISQCSELRQCSIEELQRRFGQKTGMHFYNYCRGIDNRQLKVHFDRKTVSCDVNYGIRFENVCLEVILLLALFC